MEPTKEEIKWLWEQCRARCIKCNKLIKVKSQRINSDCCCYSYELDLDLNSLFKYAVPKLQDLGEIAFCYVAWGWRIFIIPDSRIKTPHINACHSEDIHDDPALALFWAIYKAFGGKQ